jgi:hypothetical protein
MSGFTFDHLGDMIQMLDASHEGCAVRISELRRQMDRACDQGTINLREWRVLLDRLGPTQRDLENRAQ